MAKSQNARTRGPAPAAVTLWRTERRKHAQWREYLLDRTVQLELDGVIDPFSGHIVTAINARSFLPAFFLAWSKCRWNELEQIDLGLVRCATPLRIESSKSDGTIVLDPAEVFDSPEAGALPSLESICLVSYDRICHDIQQTLEGLPFAIPEGCHSATHAFRHFYASFSMAIGVPKEEISQRLGHVSLTAVDSYIHPMGDLLPAIESE